MQRDTTAPGDLDDASALRLVLDGTAPAVGHDFFRALVKNLALAAGVAGAWVTEYLPQHDRLRAFAFWLGGQFVEGFEYTLPGTPCAPVVRERRLVHVPDRIIELYPTDDSLKDAAAVSYAGVPLPGADGEVVGHLAVLDTRPMPDVRRQEVLLRIFAARAAAELRRARADEALRAREAQLGRLLDGAMDAILELDQDLRLTLANAAAETLFAPRVRAPGATLQDLFTGPSLRTLLKWVRQLDAGGGAGSVWLPEPLDARGAGGGTFRAEATLSFRDVGGLRFYTLVCRDVNDRLRAEQQIRTLAEEAAVLRDRLAAAEGAAGGALLGRSRAMRRVRQDVEEVGATDATVLVLGETGTGKEVVARAIHRAGPRRDRPFVAVNCAAVPAALIESEFFGHEKGAFTGATQRREGRFALAHGGTIFLDEIGELPLDLQGKLLRVLQEGEFEPVGSSQTRRCDVRVIAATNRDLAAAAEAGRFRPDLYYRLNVYPIVLPPLRERGDDVVLLAETFARRSAHKLGRSIGPLTESCAARLTAYSWPGNVRELENVIERAVITSRDGRLNLDRALPDAAPPPGPEPRADDREVLTARQLEALERRNLQLALERCRGRVSGKGGAAALLGIPTSTLNSRLKALGIRRSVASHAGNAPATESFNEIE
jgi:transcriptional regulator with GAF, ATPase, and Fis domain